jgi:serine/threonine protein kinase
VVHRDVKLENILLDASNAIKIIDFGLAAFFAPGRKLRVHCGSPSYAAPEIVARRQYEGAPVDVWSLGVVLFATLAGFLPFHSPTGNKQVRRWRSRAGGMLPLLACPGWQLFLQPLCVPGGHAASPLSPRIFVLTLTSSFLGPSQNPRHPRPPQELCQKIMAGVYNTPEWLSPGAKDLLSRMLTVDPDHRASLREVAGHAWVRGAAPERPRTRSVYAVAVDPDTGGDLRGGGGRGLAPCWARPRRGRWP